MCVTIFKPPAKLMKQLSPDRQLQLLKDCIEIFKTFVGAQNIKAVAYHRDEVVWHAHVFWEPMTDEHRICAKEMHNSIFFEKLNRKMPKLLREKGWKMIDDCHMYDAEEEQKLKEEMGEEKYREYRRQKKANRGRDSKTFKHDVEQEIEELNQQKMSLTEEKDTLAVEVDTLREEAQSLINSVSELQTEKDKLTEKTKELRTEKESLSDEIEDLKKESDLISYNIESLNEEKDFELSRIEK